MALIVTVPTSRFHVPHPTRTFAGLPGGKKLYTGLKFITLIFSCLRPIATHSKYKNVDVLLVEQTKWSSLVPRCRLCFETPLYSMKRHGKAERRWLPEFTVTKENRTRGRYCRGNFCCIGSKGELSNTTSLLVSALLYWMKNGRATSWINENTNQTSLIWHTPWAKWSEGQFKGRNFTASCCQTWPGTCQSFSRQSS